MAIDGTVIRINDQYLTKLGTDTAPQPQMKATTGVAER
jgi:hypothetical protein